MIQTTTKSRKKFNKQSKKIADIVALLINKEEFLPEQYEEVKYCELFLLEEVIKELQSRA